MHYSSPIPIPNPWSGVLLENPSCESVAQQGSANHHMKPGHLQIPNVGLSRQATSGQSTAGWFQLWLAPGELVINSSSSTNRTVVQAKTKLPSRCICQAHTFVALALHTHTHRWLNITTVINRKRSGGSGGRPPLQLQRKQPPSLCLPPSVAIFVLPRPVRSLCCIQHALMARRAARAGRAQRAAVSLPLLLLAALLIVGTAHAQAGELAAAPLQPNRWAPRRRQWRRRRLATAKLPLNSRRLNPVAFAQRPSPPSMPGQRSAGGAGQGHRPAAVDV